jgi:hypothetical protein
MHKPLSRRDQGQAGRLRSRLGDQSVEARSPSPRLVPKNPCFLAMILAPAPRPSARIGGRHLCLSSGDEAAN